MEGMVGIVDAPSYGANIYTTDAIVDPYPHYRRLRELGPVVRLPRHKVYAIPRYSECKAALRDDTTFLSTGGVALNSLSNRLSNSTSNINVMSRCTRPSSTMAAVIPSCSTGLRVRWKLRVYPAWVTCGSKSWHITPTP